jgi:hypothetical protein
MERQVRVLERATAIGDSDVEKVLVDLAFAVARGCWI